MGYDGKILRRALDRFEADKAARAQDFQRRREAVYQAVPRIREIDRELRSTMSQILSSALRRGTDPGPAIRRIRDGNLSLQEEKRRLLTEPRPQLSDAFRNGAGAEVEVKRCTEEGIHVFCPGEGCFGFIPREEIIWGIVDSARSTTKARGCGSAIWITTPPAASAASAGGDCWPGPPFRSSRERASPPGSRASPRSSWW